MSFLRFSCRRSFISTCHVYTTPPNAKRKLVSMHIHASSSSLQSPRLIRPMSAEPGHDSTFRNKDAIRTLDHQGQLSAPAVDRPTLLCRSVVDVASSDKTLLVVHSQLAQLHLIVNERLEVSICYQTLLHIQGEWLPKAQN